MPCMLLDARSGIQWNVVQLRSKLLIQLLLLFFPAKKKAVVLKINHKYTVNQS